MSQPISLNLQGVSPEQLAQAVLGEVDKKFTSHELQRFLVAFDKCRAGVDPTRYTADG